MMVLLLSLLAVAGVLTLILYQVRPIIFFPVSFIWLVLVSNLWVSTIVTLLSVVWVMALLFWLFSPLRRALLTKPLMKWFVKQQPPLSKTEQEALYAGGSWYENEFFTGKPNFEKLYTLGKPSLTKEEQDFLEKETVALCEMLDDWEINHVLHDLSKKAWDYIKEKKFWGLVIDKKYGGHGFSAQAHSAIIAKIASKSMAAAINVMVPNSLGPAEFLHFYGTEEQKERYLSRLAKGEEIACFALTSDEAGSDASRIADSGIVCHGEFQGKTVLGIRLNFYKRYITLAPICTLIGLAFKLEDPNGLLKGTGSEGITCALVPAHLPGVKKGERHLPMNLAFMNGPVEGESVFIPIDYIVGGQKNAGKGWQMLMECLSIGRGISLPSLGTAATQFALRTSSAYAQLRWQFKRPIANFDGVALPLGELAGFSYLTEAVRQFNALAVDQKAKPALASAIAKYHLTEIARKAVDHAMDIHGGRAVQNGPRNYLSSLYQGIPICITVEGANILTRNLIIFGQGVIRCHPYLQKEMAALAAANLKDFDRLIWRHLGFTLSNGLRGFLMGFFPAFSDEKKITRLSSALTFISDMALAFLGARLKVMESLSARLGDALSYLYLASATLKYHKENGLSASEKPFRRWALDYCLFEAEKALYAFLENFPYRFVAHLLTWIIFPWGRRLKAPRDKLTLSLSQLVAENETLRQHLTRACFVTTHSNDPAGLIEQTYQHWLQIKPLWKKCEKIDKKINSLSSKAVCEHLTKWANEGQITLTEATTLKEFVMQRYEAMQVDVFNLAQENQKEQKANETRLYS